MVSTTRAASQSKTIRHVFCLDNRSNCLLQEVDHALSQNWEPANYAVKALTPLGDNINPPD